jgi:polyisoprenoid-binding protein YceI
MRILHAIVAALCLALTAPAAVAAAEYTVDSERSELVVRLFKAGMASGLAHDHVIRATSFSGAVHWDPAQQAAASVEVSADAGSLVVDEPDARARHGLEGELDEDDRGKVQRTMESAKQLDVQAHPEMAFRSRSVRATGDNEVEITGDLTLHGTTRSVRFTTAPTVDGDVLAATAELDFLQSDFGIKPYSAMLGAVKNQDGAKLVVRLVAVRAPSDDVAASGPVSPES